MENLLYILLFVVIFFVAIVWMKKGKTGRKDGFDEFVERSDKADKGNKRLHIPSKEKDMKHESDRKTPGEKSLFAKKSAKRDASEKSDGSTPISVKPAKLKKTQESVRQVKTKTSVSAQGEITDEELLSGYSDPATESMIDRDVCDNMQTEESLTTSSSSMPEIAMNHAEVPYSRVRKKRVSETVQKEEESQTVVGIHFDAGALHEFEAPQLDDLFVGPDINGENYKERLFDQLEDIDEVKLDAANDNIAGIEQVLDSLDEVIGSEKSTDNERMATIGTSHTKAEEKVTETAATRESDAGDVSKTCMEGSVVEPAVLEVHSVQLCSKQGNERKEKETLESDVADAADAVNRDVPDTSAVGPADFTDRQLVKSHGGLKFRERTNTQKATMLLPNEIDVSTDSSEIAISFESIDVKQPVRKDGMLMLFNSHVYRNGNTVPWDIRFEIQLREGEEAVVDTGLGFRVPRGFGIKLIENPDLRAKFGLRIVSPEVVSRLEAAYSLKFTVCGINPSAYIAKNQSLVGLKVFRI